jgi:hypothetical protein
MIQHGIYHKGYVNFVHAVGKVYSLNQLCLRHGLTGLILVGGGGGGGAQYWFARPLCVMLHSTHVYNFVRELWFARMTHGFQLNCPTFKKKFLGGGDTPMV